ncbi:Hypothetical predicted protein, partial [Paramuricea clavata]
PISRPSRMTCHNVLSYAVRTVRASDHLKIRKSLRQDRVDIAKMTMHHPRVLGTWSSPAVELAHIKAENLLMTRLRYVLSKWLERHELDIQPTILNP